MGMGKLKTEREEEQTEPQGTAKLIGVGWRGQRGTQEAD